MAASDANESEAPVRTRTPAGRPLVVELIGPAGSGKTTLANALDRQRDTAVGIELPRAAHVPHVVRHAVLLLPGFVRSRGEGGWLSWKETRSMTYVRAWPRQLARRQPGQTATVLDHGPVFRLARLRAFGPQVTRTAAFERWWTHSLHLWRGLLDGVVCLDAPDSVLVERIRSRQGDHRMKARSHSEASRFLERYRVAYSEIVGQLEAPGGPQLLRVDTSRCSPAEVAARVLAEFEQLAAA